MARGAGQGSVGPQGLWEKGVFESESERTHNSLAQENCDIYPVPRRSPVARQPHSHRFCASTGDRKSNHRVAPIACSQFALLSPDPATSQQSLASYLRVSAGARQCEWARSLEGRERSDARAQGAVRAVGGAYCFDLLQTPS